MQAKEEHMRQMFVQKVCHQQLPQQLVSMATIYGVCQVKEKEAELKLAEQKLHEEFERLRRQHSEHKAALDDKKRVLVSRWGQLIDSCKWVWLFIHVL